jgi:hypothetical protein
VALALVYHLELAALVGAIVAALARLVLRQAGDDAVAMKDGRYISKCECGGEVRGVEQFGRLFTWCTVCTPVVTVKLPIAATESRSTQE